MKNDSTKPVVVLGGGITGITAALELSRSGLSALLVEKSPFFGGRAANFVCKATDACQQCGACRVEQGLHELFAAPGLIFLPHTELMHSEAENGLLHLTLKSQPRCIDPDRCINCGLCLDECLTPGAIISATSAENQPRFAINPERCLFFQDGSCRRCQDICPTQAIDLSRSETETRVEARSLIVATGYQPTRVFTNVDYGSGQLPNIITGQELEEKMLQGGLLVRPIDGQPVRRVAFIQCAGSRNREHLYCSRVCCAYGLRLARLIRHRWPGCSVTMFYMDLQNVGPDPLGFEAGATQEIELIRNLPGVSANSDGSLKLIFLDDACGRELNRVVDLLVLSVGIAPGPDNPRLAELLNLGLTVDGFLEAGPDSDRTEATGIFVAGAAAGPQSILECIAQATQSVRQVCSYLESKT